MTFVVVTCRPYYLSMMGSKLNHVSKSGHWGLEHKSKIHDSQQGFSNKAVSQLDAGSENVC